MEQYKKELLNFITKNMGNDYTGCNIFLVLF